MSMARIQKNFQRVMDETGLNQRSWALKAGLPDSAVKNVMQGKSESPRGKTLSALAAAAGVPVSRLINGTGAEVDSEVIGDLSHEPEDQAFFRLWSQLDADVKIGFLRFLNAVSKVVADKAS
jgi:transcriptional regulator with XRE-family HTH domain